METQFAETTERVQDALKETSELFTKTTASLIDSFSTQMNTGYEFYKNLAETGQWASIPSGHDGKTKWTDIIKESTASYQKAISNTLNLSKEIMEKTFPVFTENKWMPLSKKSADAILNIFTKQAEQTREFGTQFLESLQNEDGFSAEGFEKQSGLFNKLMSESIKGSETVIKELIAAYNEQAVYTQEATKKLMTNIQQQTEPLAKTHAKFTEELLHTLTAKGTTDRGQGASDKEKQPSAKKQAGKRTNKRKK
jgi:hypothetical protein